MLPPLRHVSSIIEIYLSGCPHIRKFIHYQHSQLITGFQKLTAHRIMRTPDRVIPCLFQSLNPEFCRMGKLGGSCHAVVMVDTAAAQINHLTVDPKPILRIKLQLADTEGSFLHIQHLARFFHTDPVTVQIRGIHIPQSGIFHINFLPVGISAVFFHRNRHSVLGHNSSVRIQKLYAQRNIPDTDSCVFYHGFDSHHRLVFCHIDRRQMCSVRNQVQPVRDHQIHIPVNSAAGIPASAGHSVFHNNFNIVHLVKIYVFGGVNIEIAITIRAFPGIRIVDVHICILINTFELQPDIFIRIVHIQEKLLRIMNRFLSEKPVSASV